MQLLTPGPRQKRARQIGADWRITFCPKEKKAPAKADKDLAANEVTSDTVDKKDGEKKKTPIVEVDEKTGAY